ncbi:hypothetical protein KY334_04440 [Candidatus Woesearchaeota archaeon]|nr:hypothetical protein [Candidatus Woesearchaeota archaeon]
MGSILDQFKIEKELLKKSLEIKKKDFFSLLYIISPFIILGIVLFSFFFIEYLMVVNKLMVLDLVSAVQGFGSDILINEFSEFYVYSTILMILSIGLIIISSSLFRMLTFSNFLNKKFQKEFFWKYVLGYTIPLILMWFIIIYHFTKIASFTEGALDGKNHAFFLFFVLIFFSHYLNYYTLNYLRDKKIIDSLINAGWDSVNIKNFLVPYLIFILVLFFILLITTYLTFLIAPGLIMIILSYFWLKKYLVVHYEG